MRRINIFSYDQKTIYMNLLLLTVARAWWLLLLLPGRGHMAPTTKMKPASHSMNKTCGIDMVTRWRGVDCMPLYTTSRAACGQCLIHVPATTVLPPETILTSHQAVLAEILTRYTIIRKWEEGAHIKVNCKGERTRMLRLRYCTVSSRKGKVNATQASISSALHRGVLRITDREMSDTLTVMCEDIPSFHVQEVKHE